jgi:hypothetical protein
VNEPKTSANGGADPGRLLGYLQAAGAVGAAVVGLTAYVYLLGGTVVWLRITAARLPSDNATVAFQDRVLLATGLKALFFELLLLAVITLVVWTAWRTARRLDIGTRADQRHLVSLVIRTLLASLVAGLTIIALLVRAFDVYSGKDAALILSAFVVFGCALGALELTGKLPSRTRKLLAEHPWAGDLKAVASVIATVVVVVVALVYMAVPLGLTVLVLLALLYLGGKVDLLPQADSMRDLIVAIVILAAALNAVIVPYLATPPVTFDRATVVTKDDREITGAFIGRSGEGVFLATCSPRNPVTSEEARVRVIPAEDVKTVVLGGFRYSFDVGRRPSLFALTRYFVDGEALHRDDDGFQLDVRGDREVCGEKALG